MSSTDLLGPQITFFFRDYLLGQRGASVNTVHSYRDAMKLLLRFVAERTGKAVAAVLIPFALCCVCVVVFIGAIAALIAGAFRH